jgi:hypothetical protein
MMRRISFVRRNKRWGKRFGLLMFVTSPLLPLAAPVAARAEHLVFTIVTPGTSPVWISSPEQSKDFGFQSLEILNDSDNAVASVHLKVTFSASGALEEVVDSGHVYVSLDPGEEKRLDVFLGRIEALNQKLRSVRQPVAWVKVTVESVEFADGSRWDPEAPAMIEEPPPVLAPVTQ